MKAHKEAGAWRCYGKITVEHTLIGPELEKFWVLGNDPCQLVS